MRAMWRRLCAWDARVSDSWAGDVVGGIGLLVWLVLLLFLPLFLGG